MQKKERLSSIDMLSMEPLDLMNYVSANFSISVPVSIETPENLKEASRTISKAYAYFSFITGMRQTAKMHKRMLKRQKEDPVEIEKMLMREEIFETQAGNLKHAYDTISRMVTIKQMVNQEINMI